MQKSRFFDLEITDSTGDEVAERIPITGYYYGTRQVDTGSGLLAVLEASKNWKKAINVSREFHDLAKKNSKYAEFQIQRYLQVSYKDILGKQHIRYYLVYPIKGAMPLDSEKGAAIFQEYEDKSTKLPDFDIDRITADALFDHLVRNKS